MRLHFIIPKLTLALRLSILVTRLIKRTDSHRRAMDQWQITVNGSASVPRENLPDSAVIHLNFVLDKVTEEHVLPMVIRHLICILLAVNMVLQPTQSLLSLNTNRHMTQGMPLLRFVALQLPLNSQLSQLIHPLGLQYRLNIGSAQAVPHLHTMADIYHHSLATLDHILLRPIRHRHLKPTSLNRTRTITINNSRLSLAVMIHAMTSLLAFLTSEHLILQLIILRLIDRARLHY